MDRKVSSSSSFFYLEGKVKEQLVNYPNKSFSFSYQMVCGHAWWLATRCRHVAHVNYYWGCKVVSEPPARITFTVAGEGLFSVAFCYLCILEEAAICEMNLSCALSFTLLLS